MIILICCITILITYILIFGLITFYFIKKREILNELFNINNIIDTLIEIFVCPEHFIIYIPGIVFENTPCVKKSKVKNETKDKIRKILTKINTILKKMEDLESDCMDTNNNIIQIKWILEGTIDNFTHMYSETADFYNKLYGSYKILNSNLEQYTCNNNLITLEKLVIIEKNIDYCDIILQLLELINIKDFEILFQIENNNYILCLLYNLIESVRSYKLKMYKRINV